MKMIYSPNVVAYGVDLLNIDPVASSSNFEIDEDGSFEGQLIADDADGNPLMFSIAVRPKHGVIHLVNNSTGAFRYEAAPNFSGTDSFTFTATDPRGGTSTTTVSFTVNAVNHPPTADAGNDVTLKVQESGQFTATASDPDGDTLSYSWNFGDGTVLSGLQVPHAFAKAGSYTVVLTVDDGNGGIASDSIVVTVAANAPVVLITGPSESRPVNLFVSPVAPNSLALGRTFSVNPLSA